MEAIVVVITVAARLWYEATGQEERQEQDRRY